MRSVSRFRSLSHDSIRIAAILSIAAFFCPFLFPATDLQILTFPVGLITGEHRIEVDLGVMEQPADLYFDGKRICTATPSKPWCAVDFGPTPHVHLLELIRRGPDGAVAESHQRWVNRPGQEAELAIVLADTAENGVCSGHLVWLHPEKLDPTWIEVTVDGRALELVDERASFRFPCRSQEATQIIAASAIFPDGRRAEAVTSGFLYGEESRVAMTAVALSLGDTNNERKQIVSDPSILGEDAVLAERAGSQVVFVVDPKANLQAIQNSLSGGFPSRSWQSVHLAMMDITKLYFVLPDGRLRRIEGRVWSMFRAAEIPPEGRRRIADAVAASGLVAASGPRKRAIVLILGPEELPDESLFTPAEAQAYLSEVGVPLFVLRTGKARDDGWPQGTKVVAMFDVGKALRNIAKQVLSQDVFWFPGERSISRIAAELPDGVEVAGRSEGYEGTGEAAWAGISAAEIVARDGTPEPARPFGERVEVSAVRVLVNARDAEGRPITDLTADELAVSEDGREVEVIGLEPVRTRSDSADTTAVAPNGPAAVDSTATGALPVTVYVETGLTGSMDTAPILQALARRAENLVRLGPVDLVVAGPDGVRTEEDGITDSAQLQAGLDALARLPFSQGAVERIRIEFMRDLKGFSEEPANSKTDMPKTANLKMAEALARRAIHEETRLVRRSLESMNDWAAARLSQEPRVLIAVGTGFDEQPGEFYRRKIAMLDPSYAAELAGRILDSGLGDEVLELGRELAASGLTVYPVATRASARHSRAAEFSGADLARSMHQNSANLEVDFLLLDPVGSQRHLAKAGGGRVVGSGGDVEDLVDESNGWYILTYQVGRALDGRFHEISVASDRPEIRIDHTLVSRAGTSEGRSASRLRRLLAGHGETGELAVAVSVLALSKDEEGVVTAEVTVTIPLETVVELFGSGGSRELRVSIAIENEPGQATIRHDLTAPTGSQAGLHYTLPAQYTGTSARIAIVAEDLASGIWGGVVGDLPTP